jgi:putative membrane protein
VASAPERRLHPVTIVFDLTKRLGDLIVPLIVIVFLSRSANTKSRLITPLIIGGIAAIAGISRYATYRYRYDDDDLVVRSGFFVRNERHIPYSRIQNIDAVQNVAHRFFGVAVVQVQTGSGAEPEATMSVLPIAALEEMRARVFAERKIAAASPEDAPIAKPPPVRLLHLRPRELLLAGFIENRGMALVLAALGLLSQFDPLEEFLASSASSVAPQWMQDAFTRDFTGRVGTMFAIGAIGVLAVIVFVRALSTIWAVIRLHDFTLVRDGDDLRAEYGLFTRVTATIPIRRVQTISIHERLLHRATGRAAVHVTTAGGESKLGEGVEREWLAPIIPRAALPSILVQLDPTLELAEPPWRRAHPRAVWRLIRVSTVLAWIAAGLAAFLIGWWTLLLGGLLTVRAVLRSRGYIRNLGCAIVGDRIVFRSGWLHHVTTVAKFNRIQVASLEESPLDRRAGMATVSVDTAGLGSNALAMPYLARAEARELHATLAAAAVRTPFTW